MSEARFRSSSWTPKSSASRLTLMRFFDENTHESQVGLLPFNGCFVIVYATFWKKIRPLSSDVNHILEKKQEGSFRLEVASNKHVKLNKNKRVFHQTFRSFSFTHGGWWCISRISLAAPFPWWRCYLGTYIVEGKNMERLPVGQRIF